jgi:hypothetical protein
MWFENLTGFAEKSPQYVRDNLIVDGDIMTSRANGKSFVIGTLETPSLAELRERTKNLIAVDRKITVRELIANARDLHADVANTDALFQVASQFNLLEMVSPNTTPERGADNYENDLTQGPACAVAAGAGTIYRNYFATVNGQIGQSADNQIDCLADLGVVFGNSTNRLWAMRNGYAMATRSGLQEITDRLITASEEQRDDWRSLLRVGLQWNTQVTLDGAEHLVSQVYCSALPVSYSQHEPEHWAAFAQLILDATYEATFHAAILNFAKTGNRKLFLTLVGGGAFGNQTSWIIAAIRRSLILFQSTDLDIAIVSFGSSKPWVRLLVGEF